MKKEITKDILGKAYLYNPLHLLCVKYARIWVFSDSYFPVLYGHIRVRQNPYSDKTRILAYFTQFDLLKFINLFTV